MKCQCISLVQRRVGYGGRVLDPLRGGTPPLPLRIPPPPGDQVPHTWLFLLNTLSACPNIRML